MIFDVLRAIQAKLCSSIDLRKLFSLLIGVVMIYTTFMVAGVIHQYVLKQQYINRFDNTQSYFKNPQGLIVVEKTIISLCGTIYNLALLPKQKRTEIPVKNSLICAFLMFLSTLTNNYAIILVSYPIVTMFKSCNILPIILVGVICSRVKSKSLKLGPQKIIVAIIVTAGMVFFKVFDPEAKQEQQQKNLQIIGLVLLVISLMVDGFLPDFQAQIKEQFKPQPTIMMVEIHKYCSLLALIYCLITGNLMPLLHFSWNYPLFVLHLLSMAGLAFLGNIFIYRIIKDFRQHIGPFIITTRKIISVGLSMIYFHHSSSVIQIICILVVLFSTLYEFLRQIIKSHEQENEEPNQILEIADQDLQQKNQNPKQMIKDQQNNDQEVQQKQTSGWRQKFSWFKN